MMSAPVSLRLTGAHVLRDGALWQRSVALEQGRISKGPLPEVDLTGYYILPGIIDLHGSAFERHRAPHPTAAFPLHSALAATDREAAANGVTTAWITQGWSWEGGPHGPDAAEALLAALDRYRPEARTNLRVQIRCQTHTADTADRLLAAVRRYGVDSVVFDNQLDAALHSATNPAALIEAARRAGRSPQEHRASLDAAASQKRDVPRYLCRLAEAFDACATLYGSLHDPDGETRETFSMIGAKVCTLPRQRTAAALARAVGDPILLGAPAVLRTGPVAAQNAPDLIRAGLCDVLVSDFYYPALAQAAFRLVDDGTLSLPRAWAMISSRPADILRLTDRGGIDYGRRADLAIVNQQTRAVEATLCAGRITHLAGEAAQRFLGLRSVRAMAAE